MPDSDHSTIALSLATWWQARRSALLRLTIVLMAVAALVWLGYEFWRLLFYDGQMGAVDLKLRHQEVQLWADARPVYIEAKGGQYPPAALLMMWPLLGWLEVGPARWLWAATSVLALVWLMGTLIAQGEPRDNLERRFIALLPLATYGAGATIGNGQLMVHLLPFLLVSLLMFAGDKASWTRDLAAAGFMLLALIKPSAAAPFFWLVLFVPRRLRPALLVVGGYVVLTILAVWINGDEPLSMFQQWLAKGTRNAPGASMLYDKVTLHAYTSLLDFKHSYIVTSLAMLGGLGLWVFLRRRSDIWILMGVSAIVARLWTYHGWYDDMLLLIPMLALLRIAIRRPFADSMGVSAGVLLALMVVMMMAPGGRYLLPSPLDMIWINAQLALWIIVLFFLGFCARRLKADEQPKTA